MFPGVNDIGNIRTLMTRDQRCKADLRYLNHRPDTSLHCQTTNTEQVHRTMCLFMSQLSLVLNVPTRLSWHVY